MVVAGLEGYLTSGGSPLEASTTIPVPTGITTTIGHSSQEITINTTSTRTTVLSTTTTRPTPTVGRHV